MKIEIDSSFLEQTIAALAPFADSNGDKNAERAYFHAQLCAIIGYNRGVPGYGLKPTTVDRTGGRVIDITSPPPT